MTARILTSSEKTITIPLADFLIMFTRDVTDVELPKETDNGFYDMRTNPERWVCTNGSEAVTVKIRRMGDAEFGARKNPW